MKKSEAPVRFLVRSLVHFLRDRFTYFAFVFAFVFLALTTLATRVDAQAFPVEGLYNGTITSNNGLVIPLVIQIGYSQDDVTPPADDPFPVKKKMTGSFVVNTEGGPYSFSYVNYNVMTAQLDLQYTRASGGNPQLRFLGKWSSRKSITGQVISGLKGAVGTFSVQLDGRATMQTRPILSGTYEGTLKYTTGGLVPLTITLDSSAVPVENPAEFELDFTAGHVGTFRFNTWDAGIRSVFIDYLRDTVQLVYLEAQATLIYSGTFTADTITGVATSTFKGRVGTFTVKKVTR